LEVSFLLGAVLSFSRLRRGVFRVGAPAMGARRRERTIEGSLTAEAAPSLGDADRADPQAPGDGVDQA